MICWSSSYQGGGVLHNHTYCLLTDWYELNQYEICLFCMNAVVKEDTWAEFLHLKLFSYV